MKDQAMILLAQRAIMNALTRCTTTDNGDGTHTHRFTPRQDVVRRLREATMPQNKLREALECPLSCTDNPW